MTREWEELVEDLVFLGLQIHRRTGLWNQAPGSRSASTTRRLRRVGLGAGQRPRGGSPTR
jgi:hypothetical protein